MSYEPVNIHVLTAQGDGVDGVVVRLYNQAGTLLYGSQTTDADGLAAFLLESGLTYQARFFKLQVNVHNPTYFEVLEGEVNNFDVLGTPFSPPVSPDARLCVAYGVIRGATGAPAPHVDIHFIAKFKPLLLDGSAVLTERVTVRTDKDGYVEVPLIRCGQYDATVQGMEDHQRLVAVPEQANVNISDLLFPRVDRVVFDVDGPHTLVVGAELTVTPTVYLTSGVALEGTAVSDVNWTSSDTEVFSVAVTGTTLVLRGIGAGSAELRCERLDTSVLAIPNTAVQGQPVSVTVTL